MRARYNKPRPLTPRREAYVRALASGIPSQQAALRAGFSLSFAKKAAQRLGHLPAVRTAVESIQTEGRKAAVYDLTRAMAEAQDVINFARAQKNSMAYCKAVELRAKLSGLLVERVELGTLDLRAALDQARSRVLARVVNVTAIESDNEDGQAGSA